MASVEIWVDKDTFVRSAHPDHDASHYSYALVEVAPTFIHRIFLEFDIQAGPEEATAVYLQPYTKSNSTETIDFERLTEPIPDPITWNTQPSATATNKHSELIPIYADYEWFSIDITQLYNDAKAAGSDTLGIRLKYQSEETDASAYIRTREFDETLAASILVNYEEPTCYIRGYAHAYINTVLTPVEGATIDFGFNGETRVTGADGYTEYVACDCAEENLLDLTITPPSGYTCRSPSTCTRTYFCVEGYNTEEFLLWEPVIPLPPTISNVSWSPAGDFHKLPSGASLTGSTEDLYLIGTDPGAFSDPGFSDGEALLRIGTDGAMFAVAEGDHFRFDGMEWWVLNIVCGPECSFITLADENAEAAREPKIGDEIQFSCNVDWHGEDPDEVRWYYARTPNRCFDEGDVSWTPFANEQFPIHIFEDDTDTDIVFIKAWARNAAGDIGELGDTCEPVLNLWEYHPSWWDSLLESIRSVDENIAKPIMDLFVIEGLEGWTEPPFTCPICEQVFDGSDANMEYAEHLMSHIKAFEKGWFEQ